MKKITILLVALAFSACSKPAATLADAAKESTCEVKEVSTASNIFNAQSASCSSGGRLYWFPTNEAKEGHAKMCAGFGGLPKSSGKNWTWYAPSC